MLTQLSEWLWKALFCIKLAATPANMQYQDAAVLAADMSWGMIIHDHSLINIADVQCKATLYNSEEGHANVTGGDATGCAAVQKVCFTSSVCIACILK